MPVLRLARRGARGNKLGELESSGFDFRAGRQFVAAQPVFGDHPEIAALFAERVFQQGRVVVQSLGADFFQRQRAGLRQVGVARVFFADLALRFVILQLQLVAPLKGRLRRGLLADKFGDFGFLSGQLFFQVLRLCPQIRVNAFADGFASAFGNGFQQSARPALFVSFPSLSQIIAAVFAAHLHQPANIAFIARVRFRQKRCPQVLARAGGA